jgi:hypothetical protein
MGRRLDIPLIVSIKPGPQLRDPAIISPLRVRRLALTMSSEPVQFTLPDLLSLCPLEGATNPHYERIAAESRAWIHSFDVLPDQKRAFFISGCSELLVSHAYAYAGDEEFRTVCDVVSPDLLCPYYLLILGTAPRSTFSSSSTNSAMKWTGTRHFPPETYFLTL